MVKGKECVGEPFQTKYGVPQGFVLRPLLFTLYTTPLSKIISRHNVCHYLYAVTRRSISHYPNRSQRCQEITPTLEILE